MENAILEFENVFFAYDNGRPVLDGASFCIPKGAFALVKGPSGIGKSTLLRLCCRLEEPRSGLIRFDGVALAEMDPPSLRRKICYMQQTPTLAPGSIGDNLLIPFGFRSSRGTPPPTDEKIREFLDEFHLSEFGPEDPASTLSVGQKQRVCMIRTLLLNPEIMLLDEPTSALDPKSAEIVLNRAQDANRRKNVTILMITHASDPIMNVVPQTVEIYGGRVCVR